MKELELSQSKTDPLVRLNKDGKVILRYQEFSGPVRSEVMEPHFRQPKIQRWVIESSTLKTLLGTKSNLERKTWLEKHNYKRPR
jgi:hypothetical protein